LTEPTPLENPGENRQVLVTRIFDAPRDMVFKAWTNADQVAIWWGPDGFHVPQESIDIDLRVGGRFNLTMVQTDTGAKFPSRYEIIELAEPELIVLKSEPMPEFGIPEPTIVRVELRDHEGKTELSLTNGPYSSSMYGNAEAGWTGSLDKLGRLVGRSDVPQMKLELVPIPVSDVDRARAFYEQIGFGDVHDTQMSDTMRVVQFTPPGSACAIVFGTGMGPLTDMEPGSVKGLHLVVKDIHEARDALVKRGVDAGDVQDIGGVKYVSFSDPDGNLWLLQQVPW
jgi:uncharacterized protein YndB with AHSA1/START domain/catechol 2,3-dioxygenase-like lactoylglutathione lyase family enzyme